MLVEPKGWTELSEAEFEKIFQEDSKATTAIESMDYRMGNPNKVDKEVEEPYKSVQALSLDIRLEDLWKPSHQQAHQRMSFEDLEVPKYCYQQQA